MRSFKIVLCMTFMVFLATGVMLEYRQEIRDWLYLRKHADDIVPHTTFSQLKLYEQAKSYGLSYEEYSKWRAEQTAANRRCDKMAFYLFAGTILAGLIVAYATLKAKQMERG